MNPNPYNIQMIPSWLYKSGWFSVGVIETNDFPVGYIKEADSQSSCKVLGLVLGECFGSYFLSFLQRFSGFLFFLGLLNVGGVGVVIYFWGFLGLKVLGNGGIMPQNTAF